MHYAAVDTGGTPGRGERVQGEFFSSLYILRNEVDRLRSGSDQRHISVEVFKEDLLHM